MNQNSTRKGIPCDSVKDEDALVSRNGVEFDRFTRDGNGRVTQYFRHGTRKATFGYNSDGTVSSAIDGNNLQTSYGDFYRGRPRLVTRADGSTIARTIDADGRLTGSRNARGHWTYFGYDAGDRLASIDPPGNLATTNISYSSLGSGIVQTATTGSLRVITTYDGMIRPYLNEQRAISGGGGSIFSLTRYDALGRVTFQSFPSASSTANTGTSSNYDALDRVIQAQENVPPYATTHTSYLSGNRVQVTDPVGNVTTTTYSGYSSPDDGAPTRIDQPLGITTTMAYDIHGNLLSAAQGGITQTWTYDTEFRLCNHWTPEQNGTVYDYDNGDRVTYTARGQGTGCGSSAGDRIQYAYDALGRVTLTDYPAGTADVAMTYDADGNVLSNVRGTAAWSYAWDENDLLTAETLGIDGRTYGTSYGYNSNGALATQQTPGGRTLTYAPDGHGRPTKIADGATAYASNGQYHPNGAIGSLTFGNGHVRTVQQNVRQLTSSITTAKGTANAVGFAYSHDANGRIVAMNNSAISGDNRTFQYDGVGRLIGFNGHWGTGTATYDQVGNIRQWTASNFRGSFPLQLDFEYNSQNRLSADIHAGNRLPFSYDSRGNVTNTGFGTWTYDASMRPVAVSWYETSAGMIAYDGNLNRVKRNFGGETVYSVYGLSGSLLHQDNLTTGLRTDYLRLGGSGDTVASLANGAPAYQHTDHLGSVVARTDASGAVTWREIYMPFGGLDLYQDEQAGEEGFTGHVQDGSGAVYMKARYYMPRSSRFLSPDPVGFAQGGTAHFNRYAYVNNDPVNMVDPDGREPFPSASRAQEIRNNRVSIERNREPIRQLGQDINSAQTGVAALALAPAISVQLGLACGATCGAAAIGGQIGAGTETQSQIVSGEQIDGVAIALEGFEGAINGATAARNLVAGSVSAFVTGSGNQVIDNGRNGVPLGEGAIGNGATSAIGATIGGIIGQGSDIVANSSLTRSLGSLAGSFFGQGVTAGLEDRLSDDEN